MGAGMSLWSQLSPEKGRDLASLLAQDRPSVGRVVKIISGAHTGAVGKVVWHGPSRFARGLRYADDTARACNAVRGRYGWRIRVQTEQGSAFFADADATIVCVTEPA